MPLSREEVVGLPTGAATIQVERGPVGKFATAVTDENPVYHDLAAAREADIARNGSNRAGCLRTSRIAGRKLVSRNTTRPGGASRRP